MRGRITISLWVRIDAGNGAGCLDTVLKFLTSEFLYRLLSGLSPLVKVANPIRSLAWTRRQRARRGCVSCRA